MDGSTPLRKDNPSQRLSWILEALQSSGSQLECVYTSMHPSMDSFHSRVRNACCLPRTRKQSWIAHHAASTCLFMDVDVRDAFYHSMTEESHCRKSKMTGKRPHSPGGKWCSFPGLCHKIRENLMGRTSFGEVWAMTLLLHVIIIGKCTGIC